jgi:hypothetical protein
MAAEGVAGADQAGEEHKPDRDYSELVVDRIDGAAELEEQVHVSFPSSGGLGLGN